MRHFLLVILTFAALNIGAKVTLPRIFSDNMLMQQDREARLWGTAKPNAKVTVTASWLKKSIAVTADKSGNFSLTIRTPKAQSQALAASKPHRLVFSDGEETAIDNIIFGELWICSGQSNMEMPMKGFKNQPVEGAVEDVLHSTDDALRVFTVKRCSSFRPQTDVSGSWAMARPEVIRETSATAYYFARELRRCLNVPVGIVIAAWGGSACEAWMTAEWLKAFPAAKIPQSEADIKSKNRTPTVLYNGMLSPLVGISMRGVIWYQGEDNVNRYETYAPMFHTMMEGWRKNWQEGCFPFYFCQIAPFDYSIFGEGKNSAFLREQQQKAELMTDSCAMAVLMDTGLKNGIHPRKKQAAGERLALLALTDTYSWQGVASHSARYKSMETRQDTVVVSLENAQMWPYFKNNVSSENFYVAGKDQVFHKAKAWIERSKIMVKSDEVPAPVAVRYAFGDFAEGDLFSDGLPVGSFRSDDWEK